jgi:putative transposase
VVEWQNRPLESMYPVVFFGALRVKIRDEGSVKNRAVYLALGIRRDGTKECWDCGIQQTEGAKLWLAVMNELKNRGVQNILIAVIDGLKAFQKPLRRFFPTPRFRLASYT